ncbi:MAG: tRNA-dihydrouridine synthase family protein [Desulfovibrionaceae bacterium]
MPGLRAGLRHWSGRREGIAVSALVFDPARPWLAPLAGYTDLPFRMLCRGYGAAVCCTEMVSAKGLVYKSPGTRELLRTVPEDAPLVVQVFGNEVPFVVQAMEELQALGFRYFDLNMGCSVPKVTRSGCGAAMLKDVPHALRLAKAMVATAGEGCVGFKLRLGWDAQNTVWQELAPALEDCGAAWLTLHPRFARQAFGGTAQWSALADLVGKVHIPVIASGDLFTAADGLRCIAETGVATVMYARGAMQDPAVFAAHTRGYSGIAADSAVVKNHCAQFHSRSDLRAMIARHAALARTHGCERAALFKMRTFVPRYVHHLPGVRALRQGLSACHDWESLNALLDIFLEEQ